MHMLLAYSNNMMLFCNLALRCICMKINRLFDGIWIMARVMQSAHYPRHNTVGYLTLYQNTVKAAKLLAAGTQYHIHPCTVPS